MRYTPHTKRLICEPRRKAHMRTKNTALIYKCNAIDKKMNQEIKQRKTLVMQDQHRRHEVSITPDCFKEFDLDIEEYSPLKGFLIGCGIGLFVLVVVVGFAVLV